MDALAPDNDKSNAWKVVVIVAVAVLVIGGLMAIILVRRQQLLAPAAPEAAPPVSEVPSADQPVRETPTAPAAAQRDFGPAPPVVIEADLDRELTAEEKRDRGYPESWTVRVQATQGGASYSFVVVNRGNDQDGDGLSDSLEAQLGTDPDNGDSDGDGLDDRSEREGGTDPTKADTDGDGRDDGAELKEGSDPTKAD